MGGSLKLNIIIRHNFKAVKNNILLSTWEKLLASNQKHSKTYRYVSSSELHETCLNDDFKLTLTTSLVHCCKLLVLFTTVSCAMC